MILEDATIEPVNVPDILLAFYNASMIDEDDFHQMLRVIIATKVVRYAFPFASWLMKDIDIDDATDEEVTEREKRHIIAEYPEAMKTMRRYKWQNKNFHTDSD
jgi:hypothetical protein